jgi:hypothetical protein
MMAIIEREMRKFFRSPALMMASMIFPLVQLIILGNAFGGKIREAKMGVVRWIIDRRRIKEAFDAVRRMQGLLLPFLMTMKCRRGKTCATGRFRAR